MSQTLQTVQEIFREVLDDDELELQPSTTATDVDGWDSLVHVTLMMKVEKAFGLRFRASEISDLKNVGELVALIERHRVSS